MTDRLKADLIQTSAMGRLSGQPVASYDDLNPKQGVTRPEGTRANQELRDFTVKQMREAGLRVRVDRVGNIFGTIESAAVQANVAFKKMPSGAVHDALNMAAVVRTGMIFMPSVRGISHAPMEWTAWEDIEKGVTVLTGVIKRPSQKS